MQVELSNFNERLLGEYRVKLENGFTGYNGSMTSIVNGVLTAWLVRELKVKPENKKAKP